MGHRVAVTCGFESESKPYAAALQLVGIAPVLITPDSLSRSLQDLSGLVISGGADISPAIYGARRDPRTEHSDNARDRLEQTLLREAMAVDIPVLAICRGMQLLNVCHLGGTLLQHVEGHNPRCSDPSLPTHEIVIQAGTRLASIVGCHQQAVNSLHHQAIDVLGDGITISARAIDGIIEAIERPDRRFILGVQWHPELRLCPSDLRLFQAFAAALESCI